MSQTKVMASIARLENLAGRVGIGTEVERVGILCKC